MGLTALPVCALYAGGSRGRIAARKCGSRSYSEISGGASIYVNGTQQSSRFKQALDDGKDVTAFLQIHSRRTNLLPRNSRAAVDSAYLLRYTPSM
ncbi:MAG: hypothetical protein NTV22_11080 [bacterium]|nr:hypothetical protein [bacterium]